MTQSPPPPVPEAVLADGGLDAGALGRVEWFTDVGHMRSRNEDRLLACHAWDRRYLLLLVADGAGGHDAGDKAAEAVVATFHQHFPEAGPPPDGEPAEWLRGAVAAAHRAVRDLGQGQPRPPASTVVGILVEQDSLCGWRFHVGDSRLYARVPSRPGMEVWTRDHNIINGLIDRGLPEAQALKIADGGKLTQVLGGTAQPEPDLWGPIGLEVGTTLLLCSDGAYGYNRGRDVLGEALDAAKGTLPDRIQAMKAAVLEGDAPDNATAVLWELPTTARATREREQVAQQVRGPDAAALADRAAHDRMLQEREEEPTLGTKAGPSFRPLLLGAFLALAFFAMWRACQPAPPPPHPAVVSPPAPTPAPTPADPGSEPLAWPADPRVAERVKGVVRGLDPGLWNSANATTRGAWVRLLGEVVQSQFLAPTTLAWVEGPAKAEGRTTFETWPLPGGTNAGHAAESWSARGQLLALHPTLATSGEVAGLLRDTGCRQVELRWPRLGSGPLPTAEEMALWLSACLPSSVPGASVTARLGAWPEAGWTREDFQEIERSSKPGGVLALRDPAKVGHPRLQEIALLAMVLRNPTLRDLQVQVRVILPPEDGPPGKEAVLATRAQGWASRIGALLRGAAELPLAVQEEGLVDDDPLVTARDPATLDQSQLRRLADLNRRVELVLSRGGGLEPDEASPEVPAPPPPATTPSSP